MDKKKLGEVYLRLGDLQKMNGNYQQAVEDYFSSLKIYAQEVPADDRIIADVSAVCIPDWSYIRSFRGGKRG